MVSHDSLLWHTGGNLYPFTKPVVLSLGPPDILGLQLPEAFTPTSAGEDFWELKSKNTWRPKVGDHSMKPPKRLVTSAAYMPAITTY